MLTLNGGFDPASWAILITSITTGVGTILTSLSNRKAIEKASDTAVQSAQHVAKKLTENQIAVAKKVDETNHNTHSQMSRISEIASSIKETTMTIQEVTSGNLFRMTQALDDANAKINDIKGRYNIELVTELQSQKRALEELNALINDVRLRQHDFANYLNEVGLNYQLRPLVNAKPLNVSDPHHQITNTSNEQPEKEPSNEE